jgi:hypothetical protein
MPRTTKKELEAQFSELQKQNVILDMCLGDLVRKPSSVQWIECSAQNAPTIAWGLIRLTSPSGGYIIRKCESYVTAHYLDERALVVREQAKHNAFGDPENRQLALNEYVLAETALRLRREALEKGK